MLLSATYTGHILLKFVIKIFLTVRSMLILHVGSHLSHDKNSNLFLKLGKFLSFLEDPVEDI